MTALHELLAEHAQPADGGTAWVAPRRRNELAEGRPSDDARTPTSLSAVVRARAQRPSTAVLRICSPRLDELRHSSALCAAAAARATCDSRARAELRSEVPGPQLAAPKRRRSGRRWAVAGSGRVRGCAVTRAPRRGAGETFTDPRASPPGCARPRTGLTFTRRGTVAATETPSRPAATSPTGCGPPLPRREVHRPADHTRGWGQFQGSRRCPHVLCQGQAPLIRDGRRGVRQPPTRDEEPPRCGTVRASAAWPG